MDILAYVIIALGLLAVILCIAAGRGMRPNDKAASESADEQTEDLGANGKAARPRFYVGIAIFIIICICGLSTYLSVSHKAGMEAYFKYATFEIMDSTGNLLNSCEDYADNGNVESAEAAYTSCYMLFDQWTDLRMMMVYFDLIDEYEYNVMLDLISYYHTAINVIHPSDAESTAAYLEKLAAETAELRDVMLKYSPSQVMPSWEPAVMDDLLGEIDGLQYFN